MVLLVKQADMLLVLMLWLMGRFDNFGVVVFDDFSGFFWMPRICPRHPVSAFSTPVEAQSGTLLDRVAANSKPNIYLVGILDRKGDLRSSCAMCDNV